MVNFHEQGWYIMVLGDMTGPGGNHM
eukprot:SAG22_NODE_10620_length_524_cov_1.195294_1_plen_25_part_10